jgi:hypothetical protein
MSLVLLGFRFLLGRNHESRFFRKTFLEKSDMDGVSVLASEGGSVW